MEIDGLPINSMVDLSMAMLNNQMVLLSPGHRQITRNHQNHLLWEVLELGETSASNLLRTIPSSCPVAAVQTWLQKMLRNHHEHHRHHFHHWISLDHTESRFDNIYEWRLVNLVKWSQVFPHMSKDIWIHQNSFSKYLEMNSKELTKQPDIFSATLRNKILHVLQTSQGNILEAPQSVHQRHVVWAGECTLW